MRVLSVMVSQGAQGWMATIRTVRDAVIVGGATALSLYAAHEVAKAFLSSAAPGAFV